MPSLSAARQAQQDAFMGFLERCPEASATIYDHLTPLIRTLTRRKFASRFNSEAETEDFISEVWIRLCELKPEDYDPNRGALSNFIFFKMREAHRKWRKSQGLPPLPAIQKQGFGHDLVVFPLTENDHDRGEYMRNVETAVDAQTILAEAPRHVAQVLELQAYDGLPCKTAVEVVGLERTAYYRTLKAYKKLVLAEAA